MQQLSFPKQIFNLLSAANWIFPGWFAGWMPLDPKNYNELI